MVLPSERGRVQKSVKEKREEAHAVLVDTGGNAIQHIVSLCRLCKFHIKK